MPEEELIDQICVKSIVKTRLNDFAQKIFVCRKSRVSSTDRMPIDRITQLVVINLC